MSILDKNGTEWYNLAMVKKDPENMDEGGSFNDFQQICRGFIQNEFLHDSLRFTQEKRGKKNDF